MKPFLDLSATAKGMLDELATGDESPAEYSLLVALARTMEIAANADKDMKSEGMVQVFENGARQVSPEWAIFRNAVNDMQKLIKGSDTVKAGKKPTKAPASITHLNRGKTA